MLDVLRTLWLHVAELRTLTVQKQTDTTETTSKIRTICDDIRARNSAVEEVTDLLKE